MNQTEEARKEFFEAGVRIINRTKEEVMEELAETIKLNSSKDPVFVQCCFIGKIRDDAKRVNLDPSFVDDGGDIDVFKMSCDVYNALMKHAKWVEEDLGAKVMFM